MRGESPSSWAERTRLVLNSLLPKNAGCAEIPPPISLLFAFLLGVISRVAIIPSVVAHLVGAIVSTMTKVICIVGAILLMMVGVVRTVLPIGVRIPLRVGPAPVSAPIAIVCWVGTVVPTALLPSSRSALEGVEIGARHNGAIHNMFENIWHDHAIQ